MIYRNKRNARYVAAHTQDVYTDLGFDYRGKIFSKTISNMILKNARNKAILSEVEKMISYLVDTTKQIRLQFMISLKKNDRNVN
jgi:hypothetical protein